MRKSLFLGLFILMAFVSCDIVDRGSKAGNSDELARDQPNDGNDDIIKVAIDPHCGLLNGEYRKVLSEMGFVRSYTVVDIEEDQLLLMLNPEDDSLYTLGARLYYYPFIPQPEVDDDLDTISEFFKANGFQSSEIDPSGENLLLIRGTTFIGVNRRDTRGQVTVHDYGYDVAKNFYLPSDWRESHLDSSALRPSVRFSSTKSHSEQSSEFRRFYEKLGFFGFEEFLKSDASVDYWKISAITDKKGLLMEARLRPLASGAYRSELYVICN